MSVRLRVALVAIFATVLAANAGATIYAAATAPTIRACVSTKTGAMRYVPTKACAKGETAITWNSVGPAGPTGPTGPGGAVPNSLIRVIDFQAGSPAVITLQPGSYRLTLSAVVGQGPEYANRVESLTCRMAMQNTATLDTPSDGYDFPQEPPVSTTYLTQLGVALAVPYYKTFTTPIIVTAQCGTAGHFSIEPVTVVN